MTPVPAEVTKTCWSSFGDWEDVNHFFKLWKMLDYVVEQDGRNSAVPLLDKRNINARIEPGAIIRDQVTIGEMPLS